MANEPVLTIVGNLTADPELRFTPSGDAVANFTIAATPRTKTAGGDWEDGETIFFGCSVWRQAAENVTETLTKGMRVVATGRLKQRSYTTREGEKRTSLDLDVDEVGPSLMWATAVVTRTGNGHTRAASTPTAAQYEPPRTGAARGAARPPRAPQAPADPWGGQTLADYEQPPF